MRGSPLIRALLAFLGILVLGFPLHHLTQNEAALPKPRDITVEGDRKAAARSGVQLQLTFTAVPKSVKVLHLGQELWNESAPTTEMEREIKIDFPREGVDLQFEIEWPGENLAAMRAVLTDSDGELHERSLFGQGSVTEVLTFQ